MPPTGAIRAGRAFVELFAEDSKLVRGLRAAERKVKTFGLSVQSIGAKIFAAGGAIAGAFIPTIKAASDMQEVMSKFETVFGKSSKDVKAWGDNYAKQVGRSKKQTAEFLAGTQDLLVPIGFEPGAATEMSKQITKLAVDLASFNNMQDTDTMRDLHAAMTGSGEVMKKYGVIVSEAAVKQQLLQDGLDPKKATDQQKVLARLKIILKGTTAAQGDATRTSGSFANQMKALRASIEDTAVEIGSALLPVVTPLVKKVADGVRWFGDFIQKNRELVVAAFKVAAIVAGVGAAIAVVGTAIVGAGVVFGALASIATTVGAVLGAIVTVLGALLSPIGLVIAAVVALGGYLVYATGIGGKAIKWLGEKFKALKGVVSTTLGAIGKALVKGDVVAAAKVLWASLKVAWLTGTRKLLDVWLWFKQKFLSVAYDAFYGALNIAEAVWHAMKVAWIETTSFLSDVWTRFSSSVSSVWSIVTNELIKQWNTLGIYWEEFSGLAQTYWQKACSNIQKAWAVTSSVLEKMWNVNKSVWESIWDSKQAQAAANTTSSIWQFVTEQASKSWGNIVDVASSAFDYLSRHVAARWGRLLRVLGVVSDAAKEAADLAFAAANDAPVGTTPKAIADAKSAYERARERAEKDNAKADEALKAKLAAIDKEKKERLAAIEAERAESRDAEAERHTDRLKKIDDEHKKAIANIEAEKKKRLEAADEELKKAKADWDAAIKNANSEAGGRGSDDGPEGVMGPPALDSLQSILSGLSGSQSIGDALAKASAAGSFSAAVAERLAGGTAADRTAKATEQTAKNTGRLVEAANNGGMTFA